MPDNSRAGGLAPMEGAAPSAPEGIGGVYLTPTTSAPARRSGAPEGRRGANCREKSPQPSAMRPPATTAWARAEPQRVATTPRPAANAGDERPLRQQPAADQEAAERRRHACAIDISDWLRPRTMPCSWRSAFCVIRLVSVGRSTPWPNAPSVATTTSGRTSWTSPSSEVGEAHRHEARRHQRRLAESSSPAGRSARPAG